MRAANGDLRQAGHFDIQVVAGVSWKLATGVAMAMRWSGWGAAKASDPAVSRKASFSWRFSRVGQARLLALLVCALFLTTADEAKAMGKMCLFSAVRGVVLDHGKPVEGARIERSYDWGWNGKKGSDAATTDAQGVFTLPAIWDSSLLGSLLPHEPVVEQTILIHQGSNTYKAWMFDKHNYSENGELHGKPISLVCRLEGEVTHHGEVYGICEPQ